MDISLIRRELIPETRAFKSYTFPVGLCLIVWKGHIEDRTIMQSSSPFRII